jgi:hypothetical protein
VNTKLPVLVRKIVNFLDYVNNEKPQDNVHFRDADAWQVRLFDFPVKEEEIGLVLWRYKLFNTGSAFIGRKTFLLWKIFLEQCVKEKVWSEEWVVTKLMKHKYRRYLRSLDWRYNADCRDARVAKPFVVHAHRKSLRKFEVISEWMKDIYDPEFLKKIIVRNI